MQNTEIAQKVKFSDRTHSQKSIMVKSELLGVGFTDDNAKNVLEYVVRSVENKTEKYYIVTPNPEMLVYASKNDNFKRILNSAKIALIDGVGIVFAGRILGFSKETLKERISGADFMESLCSQVAKKPITVGFFGGKGKVAEETSECLARRYPGLQVVFASSESIKLPRRNTKDHIDILFVALGFPKQEQWIAENLQKLNIQIMMGVGGSFDYISGNIPRAPKFIRELGGEWFFRLVIQPWRAKRQFALIRFIILVFKEKFC